METRTLKSEPGYDPRAMEIAEAVFAILGRAECLSASGRSKAYMRHEVVEATGRLLGGKLTVRLEFDEREILRHEGSII